ncbi:hypothetical protein LTR17_027300 [Elasticomyces elasticus]|nr:hypothetical protein LTR17_027300 [Elasticomyces elasticus]
MDDHDYHPAQGWAKVYREDLAKLDSDISIHGQTEKDAKDMRLLTRVLEHLKWPVPTPVHFDTLFKALPKALFGGDLDLAVKLTAQLQQILHELGNVREERLRRGAQAQVDMCRKIEETSGAMMSDPLQREVG